MGCVLGIDVGSGFSKAVVCKDAARKVAGTALARAGLSLADVTRTVATGYGAAMVDFSDRSVTDISCHASGVRHLFPSARTVVDIGNQFSKAIKLDEAGRVANFVLNEKCAGGSGKFLQLIARILRVRVEEIGALSLRSTKPVDFTTGCAVFAESEAVSRIAEGALPEDILAGVHKAMASKIANLVVRIGLVEACVVTGGGALDIGLVRTVETELGTKVLVPAKPQISAALGAALLGG